MTTTSLTDLTVLKRKTTVRVRVEVGVKVRTRVKLSGRERAGGEIKG